LFQFEGTLGEYSVVNTRNGSYIRRKGGISKKRMETDPKLVRLRENMKEFGMVATSSKLIRSAFGALMKGFYLGSLIGRLSSILSKIKRLDNTSTRGDRTVALGMATEEGKAILNGFSFDTYSNIEAILFKKYIIDSDTKEITIKSLVPATDFKSGSGANHVCLSAYWAKLDFEHHTYAKVDSNVIRLPLNDIESDIKLSFDTSPSGDGIDILVLTIRFYQTINGVDYILHNDAYHAVQIIDVF
jgi:hypothetical protein